MLVVPASAGPFVVLVAALALLAGCAGVPWTETASEPHTALTPGTEIVTFTRGRGGERERRTTLRVAGQEIEVESIDHLLPHVRPLNDAATAVTYVDLVRRMGLAGAGSESVLPDASLTGSGGNGRYSRSDASTWRIEFEPEPRAAAGGWEVRHVVLLAPKQHHMIERVATPWRLVEVREIVFPDGTLRPIEERTLTNGDDAARYARW